jgi:hypothetical protein
MCVDVSVVLRQTRPHKGRKQKIKEFFMAKKLAMILGVVFVVVGLLGFISNPIVGHGAGAIFQTNKVHDIVHILIGVVMIAMAATSGALALTIFGVVYALLALAGFVMGPGKLFGLVTLNQADNYLHLVLAIVLLAAGMSTKKESNPPVAQV